LNWTGLVQGGGTDQIYFGASKTLSNAQLNTIRFNGYGSGAMQLASGEIVPNTPEASTIVGGLILLAGIAWREKRRLSPSLVKLS
jgi:hypothetical protein